MPRGFAKDHPAATYLQHRQFLVFREEPTAFASAKDFYKQLLGTIETVAPLMRFLNEPLIAARPDGAPLTSEQYRTGHGSTEARNKRS